MEQRIYAAISMAATVVAVIWAARQFETTRKIVDAALGHPST